VPEKRLSEISKKDKVFHLPGLFTMLNLFCGFLSIIKSIEGSLDPAAWFIILAVLCDGMDGKLARWTNSESAFGFELDSMADLVSACLAPALLLFQGIFFHFGFLGMVFCFMFVFAGAYRLARFNVRQSGKRQGGYTGLPVPVAALTIVSFWIFHARKEYLVLNTFWPVILMVLILLMVSLVPYDWPDIQFRGPWYRKIVSGVILLFVILMAIFPHWILFPLFVFYIVCGVVAWLLEWLRGRKRLIEFFISG